MMTHCCLHLDSAKHLFIPWVEVVYKVIIAVKKVVLLASMIDLKTSEG
jgi:hypothetical protein